MEKKVGVLRVFYFICIIFLFKDGLRSSTVYDSLNLNAEQKDF